MKKFVKILPILLLSAVLLCIALQPTKAYAASVDDLTFTLNSDGQSYSVIDCNESASGELSIPNTYNGLPVTDIGDCSFMWCSSLTEVTIPDSITSIGNSAFYSCTGLSTMSIPNGVTNIGDSAFKNCYSLVNVTIPDSIKTIGESVFRSCVSLISVTIPDGVPSIGSYALYDCDNLTSVTIGNSVASIGDYAFYGCQSLTSVTIPDSVTSIGTDVFRHCSRLTGIWVNEKNPNYSSDSFGVLFNKDKSEVIKAPTKIAGSYNIPTGVTIIWNCAFEYCQYLTAITIPDGVTTIGKSAFYGCWRITRLTIPESVTTIGSAAFMSWTFLTTVTIPRNISIIADYVFANCHYLTSVTIPGSVTTIGRCAFSDCRSLNDVYYTGTQEQWNTVDKAADNDPLLNATFHFTLCETNGHTFVGTSATCDICGYTKLTLDTTNKLKLVDTETTNKNHRATVYFLGEQSVEDITDEAALKAIDANAKTHWGLASINKVQLKDNGNYVVHIHYNEGTGAKQTVAKAFTVNTVKPTVEVNGYKVAVTAGDDSCINYRATVYYLGENTVENITDEAALKTNADSTKTYWGLNDINKVQLLNNGNYVILLHYNIGTGAKQTVAKAVTRDLDEVTLGVVSGKLLATDPGSNYLHHRAVVYYLGEETSIENAISSKTYWGLNRINTVQLTQPGNYVILLHYNLEGSTKMTTTLQVTI